MAFSTCIDSVLSPSPEAASHETRLIVASEIRFSEIIAALSVALDITQGHSQGHCMRTAMIGMRLADELRLPSTNRSALFYALLLKDLGCSSNAAKMAYLFGNDDQVVKQSARLIDWTKPSECMRHGWKFCSPKGTTVEKLLKMAAMARLGPSGARKIAEIRCERGAEIARMLQLPEATADAILDLDEHWNGRGNPRGLKGEEISLLGRVCCLAQTVEVFFSQHGLSSAMHMANERRGKWFDPQLVDALSAVRHDLQFWSRLHATDMMAQLSAWEPEDAVLIADEECLDRVAEAFAKVVDAKSPWTYQHSTRVAHIAVGVASELGCKADMKRDLNRAALLHDIGKLGVSNLILDKPGKPTEEEFALIQKHPEYTHRILSQVGAFQLLADIAGAHHERLDGRGYFRGIGGDDISWVVRVLTIADISEAMSARRPYREAMSWEQIERILARDVGRGIDGECFSALQRWQDRHPLESRVESQIAAIDRLCEEL